MTSLDKGVSQRFVSLGRSTQLERGAASGTFKSLGRSTPYERSATPRRFGSQRASTPVEQNAAPGSLGSPLEESAMPEKFALQGRSSTSLESNATVRLSSVKDHPPEKWAFSSRDTPPKSSVNAPSGWENSPRADFQPGRNGWIVGR